MCGIHQSFNSVFSKLLGWKDTSVLLTCLSVYTGSHSLTQAHLELTMHPGLASLVIILLPLAS